jgi:4-amino-4-deoxy-L-arabinose transferase-like glycosyltransferase
MREKLVIILIIASFLRLYNLTVLPPGLYPDEAMNGNNAVEALEADPPAGGWKVFYPENFGREGLFINIQSLFVAAFGNQPWALRLPSAIFGILTVLGLYFLTKELFHAKLALLASFLLATSFWHINFSRIGFRAIMASAFLVWSLYLLLKSLNQTKNIGHWLLPALAGLVYGLGFHSYIAYRATPLLLLFLIAIIWKELSKIFGIFILFTFLAGLPLGIYFLENPADFLGRTAGISIFNSETPIADLALNSIKTLGMFNFVGDFNWRHNIAGRPLLFWPVGIMFLAGAYLSLRKIFKEKEWLSSESIIWFWFLTALFPVVISNEGIPHALRSIIMVPPVFILSAIGGMKIYELLKENVGWKQSAAVGYAFLAILLFESYFSYFVIWGENPNVKNAFAYNDYVIARQLNSMPDEIPKYVVVGGTDRKIERDYPISLQSILFLTDTFTEEKRQTKNFFYLTPEEFETQEIPGSAFILNL